MEDVQVEVSPKAAEEIKQLLEERGMQGHGISVSVDYAEAEAKYTLEFSEEPSFDDIVVESRGIEIYVNEESAAAVDGCTVDYVVENGRAGFSVETPDIGGKEGGSHGEGLEGQIHEFLSRNFPQIQGHGGEAIVEELDEDKGYVRLSLEGACSGCGISDATASAISKNLPEAIESVNEVDISAGDDGGMEIESPF